MFERLDDSARRSVVLAQEESRRLHHREITPAHLLLGALLVPGPTIPGASAVPVVLESALGPGEGKPFGGHIPFTGSAKNALAQLVRFANRERREVADHYDVMLAALQTPEVAEPLAAVLDVDDLRAAVAAARAVPAPTGNGDPAAVLREILARLTVIEARLDRLEH